MTEPNAAITPYRRHRLTTYSTIDSTTLTTSDVANGTYTVVFFPRYKKSPGSRPKGTCIRPSSITTTPATTSAIPKNTRSLPSSIDLILPHINPRGRLCLNVYREFFREMLGVGVAPGRFHRLSQRSVVGGLQMNACSATAAPGTFYRYEHIRIILREVVLLLR